MLSVDNMLFLFGMMDRELDANITRNYLYVLDTDFNLFETIDLTEVGFGASKFLLDEQDLYVSISFIKQDRPNSTILKISIDTLENEIINIEMNYLDSLVKYKE